MKSITFVLLAVMASIPHVLSQDENPTSAPIAHVLGDVPDGSPPPMKTPLPKFTVAPEDILTTESHQQGGRKITLQRIKPITLPLPIVPPPAAVADVSSRPLAADSNEPVQEFGFLMVGATVYRAPDSPPRTWVNLSLQGTRESVTFWSSADFALLSGFSSFIGSDGICRDLMMSWGNQEIDHINDLAEPPAGDDSPPPLPAIPPGKARFVIIGAAPSAESLAAIQALHDVYNNEYARLKSAYEGRERARIADEAEKKAHPPKPKDIILNYWRIPAPKSSAPTPAEGGAP